MIEEIIFAFIFLCASENLIYAVEHFIELYYQEFNDYIKDRLFKNGVQNPEDLSYDILHNAYLRLDRYRKHFDKLKDSGQAKAYIFAVISHCTDDFVKRNIKDLSLDKLLEEGYDFADEGVGALPENFVVSDERIRLIMECIDALPKKDRELLMRLHDYGQTREEICEEMNIAPSTLYYREKCAKNRLKAEMKKRGI